MITEENQIHFQSQTALMHSRLKKILKNTHQSFNSYDFLTLSFGKKINVTKKIINN